MNVEKIVVGNLEENCYLVWGDDKKALAIDPGDDKNIIMNIIAKNNLEIEYVINTHGHWDHTGANSIAEELGAKLLIHKEDAELITERPDGFLAEGQKLQFGLGKGIVFHTPGHTGGSVCLLVEDELFTGDTLFSSSVGRTDFPGGSTQQMMQSLARLKQFDHGLKVHPGHGPSSTIERELQVNPYLADTAFLK